LNKGEQFRAAWLQNLRLNRQLLEAVGDDGLGAHYVARARNVRRTFVHMHNARLGWLGAVLDAPPQLTRLKSREAHTVAELHLALEASGLAVADLLARMAGKQLVPGFERNPVAVLSYMIAHEAHHRGQIVVAMRLAGKPLARDVSLGLWDW
jgi:uncharacterized damage-inducible protein DinB